VTPQEKIETKLSAGLPRVHIEVKNAKPPGRARGAGSKKRAPRPDEAGMPEHVTQNIESIAAVFAKAESRVGAHQRAIERITGVLGRPVVAYVIAGVVAVWILWNALGPRFGLQPFDPPPFGLLQSVSGVSALLMTIAILTTQNRQAKLAEQRAHLDLQVNLIAEQKIAKIIALIEELRRDLPSVHDRQDSLAEAMTEAVDPQAMANALEGKPPEGEKEEGE
jgi:uncharacterized membrane protein